MRTFPSGIPAIIGVALLLSASPASATGLTYVFDMVNSNSTVVTATSLGNAIRPTSGVAAAGGPTINYTATAWNVSKASPTSVYTLSKASLGQYVGGYGVTSVGDDLPNASFKYNGTSYSNVNCGPGDCGTHQIDNGSNSGTSKSFDLIQLVFDQAVTLSAMKLNSYGTVNGAYNGWAYDDDFSYGKAATALALPTPSATSMAITSAQFAAMFTANVNRSACAATATPNVCADSWTAGAADPVATTGASKVWFVAASISDLFSTSPNADTTVDSFKLAQVTVNYAPTVTSPTPEPATWGMMVIGFGAIGLAVRRRRAEGALAAAA